MGQSIVRFAGLEYDPTRGLLTRDGTPVPLRPKCFAVLSYLIENHGRLVSKDELFEAIWPDTVVTDDSLTQCLIQIRKAIGDDHRTLIRTVPRRGYLFEATLESEAAPLETNGSARQEGSGEPGPANDSGLDPSSRADLWPNPGSIALFAVLLGAAIIGLVLLPAEQEATTFELPVSVFVAPTELSDATVEGPDLLRGALIRRLSKIAIFQVTTREPTDLANGVDVHVISTVSRAAAQAHEAVIRLVRSSDATVLWTESFPWTSEERAGIAERVARAMKVYLDPRIVQRAQAAGHQPDAEALNAFLAGLVALDYGTQEGFERAISYFETAIRLDPNFAAAYRNKAVGYGFLSNFRHVDEQQIVELWQHAQALEPDQPGTLLWLIGIHQAEGDLDAAREAMRSLRARHPDFQAFGLAEFQAQCGYLDEALVIVDAIIEEDREAIWPRYLKIKFLWLAGRNQEALALANSILEVTPADRQALLERSRVLESLGRIPEAVASLPAGFSALKTAHEAGGERGLRQAQLEFAQNIERGNGLQPPEHAWQHFVRAYAALDEPEKAVAWLAKGYEENRYEFLWYRQFPYPGMQGVRAHPDFKALMDSTVGNPDDCPAVN